MSFSFPGYNAYSFLIPNAIFPHDSNHYPLILFQSYSLTTNSSLNSLLLITLLSHPRSSHPTHQPINLPTLLPPHPSHILQSPRLLPSPQSVSSSNARSQQALTR